MKNKLLIVLFFHSLINPNHLFTLTTGDLLPEPMSNPNPKRAAMTVRRMEVLGTLSGRYNDHLRTIANFVVPQSFGSVMTSILGISPQHVAFLLGVWPLS